MRFLKKPELNVTPRQIFIDCVKEYTGTPNHKVSIEAAAEKRKRLLKCKDIVASSAKLYDDTVPNKNFKEPDLPKGVSQTELGAVYEDKFVKGKGKGRTYYELIRGGSKYGRCPICDAKDVQLQLDHYLPKSKYPSLCVNPNNLIPICGTCNGIKNAKELTAEDGMPLHLYLDKLPVTKDDFGDPCVAQFLFAEIDAHFVVTYRFECPADWDPVFQKRFANHMNLYKLTSKYGDCARGVYSEINSSVTSRMKKHIKALVEALEPIPEKRKPLYDEKMANYDKREMLQIVIREKANNEEYDKNSWQSVLYKALEGRIDDFAKWLEANEDNL